MPERKAARAIITAAAQRHLMHQLHEVDCAALRRMDILLPQIMTEAGLTEKLKNADSLQWAGTMNAITAKIEEHLLEELVYS